MPNGDLPPRQPTPMAEFDPLTAASVNAVQIQTLKEQSWAFEKENREEHKEIISALKNLSEKSEKNVSWMAVIVMKVEFGILCSLLTLIVAHLLATT